jgi:hypothetical protein
MKRFLEPEIKFIERKNLAKEQIEGIIINHGKKDILKSIVKLADFEQKAQELKPELRDHVVHALLCYVFGAYIYESFLKPSGIIINDIQWKIACLFHDIGYPVEVANEIGIKYSKTVNSISNNIGFPVDEVYFKTVPINFEKLQNNKNSFDLIQKNLDSWGLKINAKQEYDKNIDSGRVCHGMISSLSVLRIIDILYQKNNPERIFEEKIVDGVDWNQRWFIEDIIPACSAIFCHNLPPECFKESKINRHNAPLAFLLRVTDCLQEWERPSKENPEGYLSTKFNLSIDDEKLILFADIPLERKFKINSELQAALIAEDIVIQ